MTLRGLAEEVVARTAEEYRRRGYDVQIRPTGAQLPEFLVGYEPDLIAKSKEESVVIEVRVGTRTSVAERLRDVAQRVSGQPRWRFELIFADPQQPDPSLGAPVAPLTQLEDRVRVAEMLKEAGHLEAAFLLLWSAAEGAMRLIAHRVHLPIESLPPSTLLRELYSAGEISREQFEVLLSLLPTRNSVVHGFGIRQEALDVAGLRSVVLSLLAEAKETHA